MHEFVGTDSSFVLAFRRRKTSMSVWYRKALLAEVGTVDLASGVLEGVNDFLKNPGNRLDKSDPVASDLTTSIREFSDLVRVLSKRTNVS